MRVLLICGDYWHPAKVSIDGAAPLAERGFHFDTLTDAKDFNPRILPQYDAVLLSKCDQAADADDSSWMTDAVQQAFIHYIEDGGGLLAVHSATVPGKETQQFEQLLGGRFIYHPNACPVTVQPLKPHPVTRQAVCFTETDEHYRLQLVTDDADILIASYSPPQGDPGRYKEDPYHHTRAWICPAGYVRAQGKGRVCVLTPGHFTAVWLNEAYQQTLRNALEWCGGGA